ncbi:MAG: N-acetylmuramoyl-L-alanine amidase [Bacteroidales bacterium]|nr:N-acetylmuramoyl-L-alanine amidase [Bacteroidales bacterium]
MNQRINIKFGILALIFMLPWVCQAQKGEKIQTIVIDAGHGGKDPGALGKNSYEADINLAVALKLGDYIKENMRDVKVIYTRDKDKFVELNERANIANRNNADLFISIHCNSTEGTTTAKGVETFVMGESKNEANLKVAKAENAAILLEDNTDAYDNFDPNSTEAYILFSLSQSLYQNQSLQVADKVQHQLVDRVGRHDRGVQQAGFLVLWKTAMPSILVELGFINNINEEKFLSSEQGQTKLALALYRAFEEYKIAFDADNQSVKPTQFESHSNGSANEVVFMVQFASRDKKVPVTDKAFSKVKDVDVYEYNGAFRYTSGHFATKAEAIARQAEVRAAGFSDAFVIAFVNGERATLKQAEAAMK